MKTFPPQQSRQKLVTFLFGMTFLAVMAACGTSAESARAVAVTFDEEVTATNSDGVAAATAPVDRSEDNEATSENAPDVADERPANVDVDKSPNGRGDDAGNANQEAPQTEDNDSGDTEADAPEHAQPEDEEPKASAPTNDASAPESEGTSSEDADPASPVGEQADTGDSTVAAIARDVTTYECPANSAGTPSQAHPFCSREQIETFPPGPRTELFCIPRYRLVDDVCERPVRDDARFSYTCPRAATTPQTSFTSVTTVGSGPDMSCRYQTHAYYEETVQYSCDVGHSLEQRDGIEICVTSAVEVEPIVLDSGLHCIPLGSILAEDPGSGRLSCELAVEELVPAVDKNCAEGIPVEEDSTVTSCRIIRPKYLDATEFVVLGCPDNAVEASRDTNGRPQCIGEPDTYPPTGNWSCPPGARDVGQGNCEGELLQDRQTGPTATPCPEGQAALTEDRDVCSPIPTLPADPQTFDACPDDTASNDAGECSIIRTIDVAAIERTTVEYSCPGGSTGQPTATNPFCQKNT